MLKLVVICKFDIHLQNRRIGVRLIAGAREQNVLANSVE